MHAIEWLEPAFTCEYFCLCLGRVPTLPCHFGSSVDVPHRLPRGKRETIALLSMLLICTCARRRQLPTFDHSAVSTRPMLYRMLFPCAIVTGMLVLRLLAWLASETDVSKLLASLACETDLNDQLEVWKQDSKNTFVYLSNHSAGGNRICSWISRNVYRWPSAQQNMFVDFVIVCSNSAHTVPDCFLLCRVCHSHGKEGQESQER